MRSLKLHTVYIILFMLLGAQGISRANSRPNNGVNMYGTLFIQPRGLEGSPYLFNDWSLGTVSLYNGQTAADLRVKFNILDNNLIFYNEKFSNLFTADRETVNSFLMQTKDGEQFAFVKYNADPVGIKLNNGDFVHLIYNGKLHLLAKYTASVTDANDLNAKDKINPITYYFITDKDKTSEIKLKTRSLIKLYPERKQEIKKLASQLRFRKNSVESMIRLIQAIER